MAVGAKVKILNMVLKILFIVCLVNLVYVTGQSTSSTSTLGPNFSTVMNATATLVSKGGVFELGFTPAVRSNLTVYTLAIWYVQTPAPKKVVWVADRSMALRSIDTASLSLSAAGDLEVHGITTASTDSSPKLVWTSTTRSLNVVNATLEDTGNLVLRNGSNAVVWQSFDSPTDTLLPNQILAANNSRARLTAWENDGDWRDGNFSLQWSDSTANSGAGNLTASWRIPYSWDGVLTKQYWSTQAFTRASLETSGNFLGVDASGKSFSIGSGSSAPKQDLLVRLTLDKDGNLRIYSWSVGSSKWIVEWTALKDNCSILGFCGPYAICNNGECSCPEGFHFVDDNDARMGCRRIYPAANCLSNQSLVPDTFVPVLYGDWPFNDLYNFQNINITTCMRHCLDYCTCQAVIAMPPDQSTGISSNCWLKRDALLGGVYTNTRNSYLRTGSQPPAAPRKDHNVLKIVASTLGVAVAVLLALSCVSCSMLAARRIETTRQKRLEMKWVAAKGAMVRFSYREIVLMTTSFETKIGEGGFGTVFKGQIGGNVTVAVKRLNKELSSHVEKEFLNEVDSIGLIHHVHLVSLLGYCAEGGHRLLVYEYVERGSLDRVLFMKSRSLLPVLEWRPRFAIAIQTARGLAYLHDDCNQRIIHCDVKPGNILLDFDLSAKVADFGLSRIMKRDQTRTVTMQIRGTRGYLAPEWTSDHKSITNKVDVYSYGMVLLEIVSGRRNLMAEKPYDAPDVYFPTWAFPKMETDQFMDVVDPVLTGIANPGEVKRALQVAFWCINGNPQARPTMSEVVLMLQGLVAIPVPVPKPDYFADLELDHDYHGTTCSESSALHWSTSGASAIPVDETYGSVQLLTTTPPEHSLV